VTFALSALSAGFCRQCPPQAEIAPGAAKALGFTIPAGVLSIADEVIESMTNVRYWPKADMRRAEFHSWPKVHLEANAATGSNDREMVFAEAPSPHPENRKIESITMPPVDTRRRDRYWRPPLEPPPSTMPLDLEPTMSFEIRVEAKPLDGFVSFSVDPTNRNWAEFANGSLL
jgi:hypothetical protein